jgi:hypothetical protein
LREIDPEILALFGGLGLKGCNLLFYFRAFAFRAAELLFLIFRESQGQVERLIAFFANEIIYWHGTPPIDPEISMT